jgi:NADPH:quinone reductase-like Zn-dependent oxidoreductase
MVVPVLTSLNTWIRMSDWYNDGGPTEQLKDAPVNLIFDCVGRETVVEAPGAIKAGGKVVSAIDFAIANCTGNAFMVQPSAEQLTILAKLIDDGAIKLPNVSILALADAAKAHDLSESERTVGKFLLKAQTGVFMSKSKDSDV